MPRISALRIAVLTDANFSGKDGESQAFMLPSSFSKNTIISPLSALARSDDRNAIILFSASVDLFLANLTNASILLRKAD